MASYHLDFKPSVEKDLRRLPILTVERALRRIESLRNEPCPRGAEKLESAERLYRIPVGEYRVVYEVDTRVRRVTILYVRRRRDVYRAL